MNYKNRDDELIRKQKEGQAQTRANITVKQNATNNKVYSQAALQKLASGNYRKVPELKKTVSQNSVSQNSAPKTTTPKQETKQQKPSTRYNQNISTQEKKSTRDTRYDNDFNEFHKYRVGDRIGVMDYDANSDREVEHWRNLKTEIMAKNKWTEKEFDDKWDAYYKERAQREANQEVGDAVKFAEKHPVFGTLLQGVYTPQAMIEGGASMLSALAPKEYKAQSADDTLFTGTRAKEGIKQAVKENNIKTGFGRGAYDLATSLGDMAFSAGIPVLGTAALGTQTAARTNMQALERGVDPTKAALTGLGAGAISGVLNKVGLDKAVNTTAKTALGSVLKAAGIEGAENVTEDTANLLLDTVMNKDKSQLNAMHDYYKNQGMTDDEAWNRVTLGTLGDLGISALSGAAFGGVMNGASKIPELVGDIRAIIPEMNNRGAVDPKALAEEARLNVKGPAKVEMPKKYQGLISEDDYSYIFDERNNGIFNTINLVRQHAGNTPEAQQLAKDAKKSLRKYVEGGNVDDYYEFLGHIGDLSNLAENTKADYVTKGGRRYVYDDFFSGSVEDDVNGGTRQENFYDYIDNGKIPEIVNNIHKADNGEVDPKNVIYHAGTLSRLNKADSAGKMEGTRDTGYYGTGHYFVDGAHKGEIGEGTSYGNKPYSSVDISKYNNLFKADSDAKANKLHSFSQKMMRFINGYNDKYYTDSEGIVSGELQEYMNDMYSDYKSLFGNKAMSQADFEDKLNNYRNNYAFDAEDRGDSAFTTFMKEHGYNGVDTRGTRSADTERGVVIYDLDEDSVLQSNVTDADVKNGLMNTRVRNDNPVFDTATDERIQKSLDSYSKKQQIKQEYERIFDSKELDKFETGIQDLKDEIRNIEENVIPYEEMMLEGGEGFEKEVDRTYREFKQFDPDVTREDIVELLRNNELERTNNIQNSRFKLDNLKQRLKEYQGIYDNLVKKSEAAYEQARANVEGTGDRALTPEEVSRLQDVVDGKYDIPENGNLSNSTKIPEYTMGEDVYFRGSDADIAQAEAQDQAIIDTFKNIIADPEFNALSFKNGSKEVYVSPATNGDGLRMSYTIDGVPTGHHDYSLDQLDDLSRNLRNEAGNGGEDIKIQRKSDMAKAPVPELSNGNEPPRRSFFDDLPRSDKEGKSKVGTNTAVNSNVYTRKQIDSDPIISELNKYAKANNDLTFNQAKEDIINEGSQILEDYTSGKRTISNDLDVDRAMILLTDMAQKISAGDKDLIPQRDLLFSKLRQAGTLHGQTIQAFKKWNNTAEGAIINGERIIEDTVKPWKTQNKKKVELNARIAKALEQMGVDSSMRNKPNTEKTHEQIKQGVKNVIEREFGSVENLFNDNDIEYLTSLAENKEIPVWVITDEIEHKMNHGEWYTIDESTPVKLETSSKLASILKNMGNDSLKEKNRLPDLGYGESHASIVQKIRNTLAQDPAAVDLDNPADVEVLANFIEEKIPNWQIEDEIHHRLMTGEWYTLDESIEPKKPINQRLKNALDDLVEKGPAPEKEPPTLDEIRNEVRATLDKEMARTGDFTDDDVNYLASLIQNGATKQELSEALNTKMATGKFGISPETQQQVSDLFAYANRFDPNSKQAFDLRTAAYKLLAEESVSDDATPFEKFESWRYLAMLGNPKTMVRNWIGNKMFGAVTGVSNNLSAALEAGTDRLSKALGGEGIQRTKTFLNPVDDRALIKAAGEDGEAHRYTELNGTKYEKGTKDAIKQQKSSFNSKLLRLYEAVTDRGISDYNAVKKKYSTSLAGYMKANGLDESAFDADDRYRALKDKSRTQLLTDAENAEMNNLKSTVDTLEKARDYAVKQAEYATFHEDNAVAKWLTKTSNSAPGPLRMVLEGLVPFKKTPANILRSGVEYSPLGAVKSIAETGKLIYENTGKRKGNLDDTYIKKSKLTGKEKEISKSLAADVLDSWSRTLTGTGLVGLGYYLKNKGILNSSNDDEKWQDDLEGKQNYSITINGKTYTLDWAAPAVMPLLMGAEMSKIKDRNGLLDQKWYENLSEVIGTANAILDPIFETSMMQGVKTTLEQAASDIKYNEDNAIGGIIGSMALNTGLGYLTQALPTLSGQVARTVDNTRRTTDTVSDGALGVLEKQGRKIMNKIPGLSMLNQPYYDSYGRTQNNGPFNNPLGNMAYQMLSPAYVRDINTTAADESARNAYYGLGEDGKPMMDAKVFPSWKSKVTVGGEKFTPEEMASYRKSSGEANYAIRDALTKEDWFNNLSGAEQSEILKKTNTLVDKIGKDSVDKLDSSSKEFEAYQAGGVEGLLNKWSGDIYSSKAKEETGLSGSTNAIKEINAAYAEGDTKKAEELTEKYTKYNKERERLNEKYGVNIKMADFTKREEANPGSNEAWAKEHSTGTTNNTTSTTTAPQVTTKDTSSTVDTKEYQKYIDRAGKQNRKFTNDIPKLKELNYSNSEMYTYAYAINQDSSLTPQTFNTQYKKLDLDGNGSMKQDEMITYFNNNNTSEQQANYLWRTYGENKGTPWKTLPVLRNGKWKKNK